MDTRPYDPTPEDYSRVSEILYEAASLVLWVQAWFTYKSWCAARARKREARREAEQQVAHQVDQAFAEARGAEEA